MTQLVRDFIEPVTQYAAHREIEHLNEQQAEERGKQHAADHAGADLVQLDNGLGAPSESRTRLPPRHTAPGRHRSPRESPLHRFAEYRYVVTDLLPARLEERSGLSL
jgi:hypothetical protein